MKTPSHVRLSVESVIDLISTDRNEEVMSILRELKQRSTKRSRHVRSNSEKAS